MTCTDFGRSWKQNFLIITVRINIHKVIQNSFVFFFKHLSIFTKDFISVIIVSTVFCNFINKEQRQNFYSKTCIIKLFFFLKMAADSFANLNTADVFFCHISSHFSNFKNCRIRVITNSFIKANQVFLWQNFSNVKSFIFRKSFTCFIQLVTLIKFYILPFNSISLFYFNLKLYHRSSIF